MVAGLTLNYNSGAVEGTVNCIKQLKAAMTDARNPTFCASADTPGLNIAPDSETTRPSPVKPAT